MLEDVYLKINFFQLLIFIYGSNENSYHHSDNKINNIITILY